MLCKMPAGDQWRHPLLDDDVVGYQRKIAREVFAKYHEQMRRLWINRILIAVAAVVPVLVVLGFKWF
jgi:hypothetical protein